MSLDKATRQRSELLDHPSYIKIHPTIIDFQFHVLILCRTKTDFSPTKNYFQCDVKSILVRRKIIMARLKNLISSRTIIIVLSWTEINFGWT